MQRCYVYMFNADQNLVENFSLPKPRGTGDYPIRFHCFAWNPETLVAEMFIEFDQQVYTTVIYARLKELGALSVDVITFKKNDSDHSAASALNRVLTAAKVDGFKKVESGICKEKLASKLREIQANEGTRTAKQAKKVEDDEKIQAVMKMSLEVRPRALYS